jgi:magnesium chelatase family protein
MYITGYAPYGADGIIIRVETDIRRGIPGVDVTGLAEGAVREARERVRAAFRNSGLDFPLDRVLINLAPAGLRKDGAALDLPIAVSVMAAAGLVPGLGVLPEQLMVLGELELSGRVRPVRGVLAAVTAGLREGIRFFIVPKGNEEEAAILLAGHGGTEGKTAGLDNVGLAASSVSFAAVSSLEETAHALVLLVADGSFPPRLNTEALSRALRRRDDWGAEQAPACGDFAEARGQKMYKRALEIAAAGGHNLFVFGPPGSGKTMLARRMPSIMAPLAPSEAVEVTRLHSLASSGEAGVRALITAPPFRSPHHSASAEGVLGGGRTVRPGEITLAHFGILFLDEAPEFRTNVLQALREPLEDHVITIARAEGQVQLPADFQLILAANACPCGRLGARSSAVWTDEFSCERWKEEDEEPAAPECFCSPEEIHRYWRKISGALLDRIELRIAAPPPGMNREISAAGEPSFMIARRVEKAVETQRARFAGTSRRRNARMSPSQIDTFCALDKAAERAFRKAVENLALSGRGCHGVLRTARTIADLEGAETIHADHILEAVHFRRPGEDPFDILSAGDC